jgi:hypothetical protein
VAKIKHNNFALVLIIAFTGKQSYYNDQYMYLFTQQLYIINNTDKTLITCLLIFRSRCEIVGLDDKREITGK